jgi:hypothetical protein
MAWAVGTYEMTRSPSGRYVACVAAGSGSGGGVVTVADPDGSEPRTFQPQPDATHTLAVTGFTPDESAVVVSDDACANDVDTTCAEAVYVIPVAGGAITSLPGLFPPRPGVKGAPVSTTIGGASVWSPDGTELILTSGTALLAVNPTTGAQRTIATLGVGQFAAAAGFLDAQRVLWTRFDDEGETFTLSLHLAGLGSADTTLIADQSPGSVIALTADLIAVAGNAVVIDGQGDVRVTIPEGSNDTDVNELLGAARDHAGVVAVLDDEQSSDASIEWVGVDGDTQTVATPASYLTCLAPCAAYSPD